MKVLVLGSGAREHGLVRALAADPEVTAVVAAPGNPGIAAVAQCVALDINDPGQVVAAAQRLDADLVVVGPEAPLVAGVADALADADIACYGPSRAAARLESSKAYAKEVMSRADVPTAFAHIATTMDEVADALDALGAPYVVKEDGLAAGKGVVVTNDREVAVQHAADCLAKPGGRVVIEEYLDGPEVSVFCVCDGERAIALAPAQDFKRVGDDDAGPNTGGMGAYSPLEWLPEGFADEVVARIAQPIVSEMRRSGTPFVGTLYVGLAVTPRGMRVVEFNVRFGDPDSQVVLARLITPLGRLLNQAARGRLDDAEVPRYRDEAAVNVVIAAANYPATPTVGDPITGLDAAESEHTYVLHAGTAVEGDAGLVSAGGRVLDVVALGPDLATARARAYEGVAAIDLPGSHHRSDIALKAERGEIRV